MVQAEKRSAADSPVNGDLTSSTLHAASAIQETSSNASIVEEASLTGTADSNSDLAAVYEAIQKNKEQNSVQLDSYDEREEERPDPGFRIFHVDTETGEKREVPPYTQPGEFLQMVESEKKSTATDDGPVKEDPAASSPLRIGPESEAVLADKKDNGEESNYSETTYDGYQAIIQSNSRTSREDELAAMREARRRNRLGQEEIDSSQIGAQRLNGDTGWS